jgi:cob(I)alamin adenosyltransferase
MKIYTKTGDKGETSLLGGTRVPKYDLRIEAYGTVDELNSHIGLLRDKSPEEKITDLLVIIQDRLFSIGSNLAMEPGNTKFKIPQILESDIEFLEQAIDAMNETLYPLHSFILPGGHETVSFCHIARCVCRRAERNVIYLATQSEVSPIIIKYLNRLSDFLFVLSRKLSVLLEAKEIEWKPKL